MKVILKKRSEIKTLSDIKNWRINQQVTSTMRNVKEGLLIRREKHQAENGHLNKGMKCTGKSKYMCRYKYVYTPWTIACQAPLPIEISRPE